MQDMVDGKWDPRAFLVVPPGKKIKPDPANPGVITAE